MAKNKNIIQSSFRIFNIVILVILLVLATAFPASAADSIDSDAQIELEPGVMEIAEVPSLAFSADYREYREKGTPISGEIKGMLVIEDARGTNAGWSVFVSLGTFSNASEESKHKGIGKPILRILAPDVKSATSNVAFKGYEATMVAGDENSYKVASAPPGTRGGTWNVSIPGAFLSVGKASANPGKFQTKLNWSIQDTP